MHAMWISNNGVFVILTVDDNIESELDVLIISDDTQNHSFSIDLPKSSIYQCTTKPLLLLMVAFSAAGKISKLFFLIQ